MIFNFDCKLCEQINSFCETFSNGLRYLLLIAWCFHLSSPQDVVLMRALRDMNLPKFVFEDVPLFLGLISDLFPGLDCPRVRYLNFNDAVEHILQEHKYVPLSNQVPHLDLRITSIGYRLSHCIQLKDLCCL